MILDTLKNLEKYTALHPLFSKALDYIRATDLATAPEGKGTVTEGLNYIISMGKGKSPEASLAKFECHDQWIDIQYCIKGEETIGWKPREKCIHPNGDYIPEKDVRYFNDDPDMYFQLTDGQFAIFFPEDVHAPMIGEGTIKKLVLKVKI